VTEITHQAACITLFSPGGRLPSPLLLSMGGIRAVGLAQMEAMVEMVEMMPLLVGEDGRTESLSTQIATYQTRLARVKNVLRKTLRTDHYVLTTERFSGLELWVSQKMLPLR
jgi:hypothetical protein